MLKVAIGYLRKFSNIFICFKYPIKNYLLSYSGIAPRVDLPNHY